MKTVISNAFIILLALNTYSLYPKPRVANVSTVPDLLNAIESNTTIRLAPGYYDLSKFVPIAPDIKKTYTKHARSYFEFPNVENNDQGLLIHDIRNFQIIGSGSKNTKIVHSHGYATILIFHNSHNVKIEGVEVGHLPKHTDDFCSGGVITFRRSSNIQLKNVDLFGSGIFGFTVDNVNGFLFKNSTIRECTNSIAIINNSKNVVMSGSHFINNTTSFAFFPITANSKVTIQGSRISGNKVRHSGFYKCQSPIFLLDRKSSVSVDNSTIEKNQADGLRIGNAIVTSHNIIKKNIFKKADSCATRK